MLHGSSLTADPDADFVAADAIGFWLRRGIEGSKPGLWIGLQKLMNLYDAKWFKAAQAKRCGDDEGSSL